MVTQGLRLMELPPSGTSPLLTEQGLREASRSYRAFPLPQCKSITHHFHIYFIPQYWWPALPNCKGTGKCDLPHVQEEKNWLLANTNNVLHTWFQNTDKQGAVGGMESMRGTGEKGFGEPEHDP